MQVAELPRASPGKVFANVAETIALVGGPVLAMIELSSADAGAWPPFGLGLLAFVLAWLLGQRGLLRLVTNLWKKRARAQGFHDAQALRGYLLPRLIPIGAIIAGVFEETARLAFLSWLLSFDTRPWVVALAFGLGHGGIEAILLGIAIGVVGTLDILRPVRMAGLTLDGIRRFRASEHWMGIGERAGVTLCHLIFTLLVAHTVLSGEILWYLLAIVLHAGMDFVYASGQHRYGWTLFRLILVPWVTALVGSLLLWASGGWLIMVAPA